MIVSCVFVNAWRKIDGDHKLKSRDTALDRRTFQKFLDSHRSLND